MQRTNITIVPNTNSMNQIPSVTYKYKFHLQKKCVKICPPTIKTHEYSLKATRIEILREY